MNPSLPWSSEQQAIFSFVATSSSNLIVEAVAGAGKSTTLREAIAHVPAKAGQLLPPAILVLSFDKATQEKTQLALGAKAVARTCSSLGLAALRTSFPKIKVDLKKAGNAIFPLFRRDHEDVHAALRALSLLKSCWPLLTSPSEAGEFLANNDIDFVDPKTLGKVLRALEATLADTSACDFDDMLVMPLVHACHFPQQDFVLVDEAQDTNDVQLEILNRLDERAKRASTQETPCGRCCRFLFVGDPSQAIYGFRGANSASMERIAKCFSCESLPLSVTYRCPSLHVELARHYIAPETLSQITARPDAPLGTIEKAPARTEDFIPGSIVLCRNTAPLVRFCYALLSRDIPCRIKGKDIGAGLATLAKSFKVDDTMSLSLRLSEWLNVHVNAALKERRSPEGYYDKHDALVVLMKDLDSVNALLRRIERVFDDTTSPGVLLSTIHKFKGGEAERVFLLDFDKLLPSKYATREWQLRQERNLQYVAVTRSSKELWFISSEEWEESESL